MLAEFASNRIKRRFLAGFSLFLDSGTEFAKALFEHQCSNKVQSKKEMKMQKQTQKTHEEHIAEIWRMFKEGRREAEKSRKEAEKSRKEAEKSRKEAEKSRKEAEQRRKKADREMKELKELFTGQWGKLMESLVEGDLVPLLNQKGIEVEKTFTNMICESEVEPWEFDIIAVNGREIVIVEVKTTLSTKDVKYFLKKLSRVNKYMPEYKDKKVYGAVAYLRKQTGVDVFAEREGLFVIRATGNSASITNKKNFKPKTFPH